MTERQMGSSLWRIRPDHIARYEFAIDILKNKSISSGQIIDAGCGVGYGSWLLSVEAQHVDSIDYSEKAEECFLKHWKMPNIDFHKMRVEEYRPKNKVDAVVCFEFIEHTPNYAAVIEQFSKWSDFLILSTPNQNIRPFQPGGHHIKHFTPDELAELLSDYGYAIESWHNQARGRRPAVRSGPRGKFMIVLANKIS